MVEHERIHEPAGEQARLDPKALAAGHQSIKEADNGFLAVVLIIGRMYNKQGRVCCFVCRRKSA